MTRFTAKEIRILRAALNENFVKPLQELRTELLEDNSATDNEKIYKEDSANE